MQCRKCSAAIADKALICYRCGTATTEAKYQPAATPGRGSSSRTLIIVVILIALLALLALYLSRSLATPALGALPLPLGHSAVLFHTEDTKDTKDHGLCVESVSACRHV